MSILCVSCYIILRIGGDFTATGQSQSIYTSTSLTEFNWGLAELLLSLLANTTLQFEFCTKTFVMTL